MGPSRSCGFAISLAVAAAQYPWQNTSLPTAARVANLISLLTVEEKVLNLVHNASGSARIGLPPYEYAHECERGFVSGALGTAYPTPLALAGTFNPQLVADIAYYTALEARAAMNGEGGRAASCFAPVVNEVRDPRWGRNQEMIGGEDAAGLGRVMTRAWVASMQAYAPGANGKEYLLIHTIAKHINAYGGPEGWGYTFGPNAERFSVNAIMDERTYRETFLPGFYGGAEAGVRGYMCSYSAITLTDNLAASNNTPACANGYLLNDIIRNEWAWDGYVMSDAGAVYFEYSYHDAVPTGAAAALAAITNGMDIELTCCGAPSVFLTLVDAVNNGTLSESVLDVALTRALTNVFDVGALDPLGSSPYDALNGSDVYTPSYLALAADAARQSIVLLKNANGALPVSPARLNGRRVCVLGPNANNTMSQMGEYVPHPRPGDIITPYAGLVAALPNSTVLLAEGCNTTACPSYDPSIIPLASSCDLNVVVLGTTAYDYSKNESAACGCPYGDAIEGECCDRQDVQLAGAQLQLLQAVVGTGKPTILVTVAASMLDLTWANANVDGIINAIFLGQFSGQAIAETILGLNNPSAKLATTHYAGSTALPNISDYSMAGRTYRWYNGPVQYPFGHGLSYSTFVYDDLSTSATSFTPCTTFSVRFTLRNPSSWPGYEAAQLYLSTFNATVPVPLKRLVNFQRTFVPTGSTRVPVWLDITPEDMAVLSAPGTAVNGSALAPWAPVIEPGVRTFWVGTSSDASSGVGLSGSFTVMGSTTPLAQCEGYGIMDPRERAAFVASTARGAMKWAPPRSRPLVGGT